MKNPLKKNNFDEISQKYYKQHVLVLGACGFIGRWVARALSSYGAQLYLIDKDTKRADSIFSQYTIHGEFHELNLTEFDKVNIVVQKIKPKIIFNLAGYGVDHSEDDIQSAYRINANLVESICDILVRSREPNWEGQDLVHVGSALEYGIIGGNLSEDSIPEPTTWYGKSKLGGTNALVHSCQAYGIKGVTARLFTVYGPGEHKGRLLPSLLEAAKTSNPIPLTRGKQKRDFTYVEDVAEGLLRLGLVRSTPGLIVNLATGCLTSVRQFTEMAATILHIPFDKLQFGAIPTRIEEMNHEPVTIKRLLDLTYWVPPTSINEGIQRTLIFEKEHD